MKKRAFTITLFIFILVHLAQTARSQVLISLLLGDKLNSEGLEFGIDGGLNYSTITGLDSKTGTLNLHLGFYFDILLKDRWYINTGVMVKSEQGLQQLSSDDLILMGEEMMSNDLNYMQKISYFYVPARFKYRFENRLFFEMGPMVGLRNRAMLEVNYIIGDKEIREKTENKDRFNPIDFGLTGGMGYKLKESTSMNFGVRYYFGMTRVIKEINTHHSTIYLFATIPVGAGKEQTQ